MARVPGRAGTARVPRGVAGVMDDVAHLAALRRGSDAADLARALAFLRGFARRRAPREVPVPGGVAVLDERYAGSYDDNRLLVWEPAEPGEVLRAADEVLAGYAHRLVTVGDDRLGEVFAPAFARAGYAHEVLLVMAFRGAVPEDPPPAEPLETAELMEVLRRDWRRSLPEAGEEVVEALARRVEHRVAGADRVLFRGVRAPGGEIAARADLYLHGGVAQIEDVWTAEEHRGRGHACALLSALLAEAAGAELIFLVADAADWPKDFYARLGFAEVGRTHSFQRA
ncbi:GNAT family N-acetyltransferase [Nonomuraea sp. LP-02]|uniref:GNAT family N-acetyltransferase n=1 Tax=Nonomuraea sp. LP-02 TaxID=3097960 RepID=UPI002E35D4BB|nr:GNAT family N-acetyltransferase [Nonomuraea sp. LP-02]MED7924717.1 GNAT family N-acetyltransferase [Nonomuraea sp. LP-02]